MDDGVEVIWHQTELQDARFGVIIVNIEQFVNDRIAKVGAIDGGLGRIVVGDDKAAEDLFAVRGDERHVIDADTTPCPSVFLPMPRFCHRSKIWCKGTINNRDMQIYQEKNIARMEFREMDEGFWPEYNSGKWTKGKTGRFCHLNITF